MSNFDPTSVPREQIPTLIAALLARLLEPATPAPATSNQNAVAEPLLTAGEIARRLSVPETWCCEQARLGKLPCVKLGRRYVRFRLTDVEAALEKSARCTD